MTPVRLLATTIVSDVGRKRFGFGHEEIEGSNAYYEGQFSLYQRNGEGTLHSIDTGLKYVGQFQCDQFHGQGHQDWPDGSYYVGQWRHNQKHGEGKYVNAAGLAYTGQWELNKKNGKGVQSYANGDCYEGWFFRGQCSGTGTYHFADGSVYEGAWANGRYDGMGILYGIDGTRERQTHTGGILAKREVLKPGERPRMGTKLGISDRSILYSQTRDDVTKPGVLTKPQPSRFLIQRENIDLHALPLLPKCHQAELSDMKPSDQDTTHPAPLSDRCKPVLAETLYTKYFSDVKRVPPDLTDLRVAAPDSVVEA